MKAEIKLVTECIHCKLYAQYVPLVACKNCEYSVGFLACSYTRQQCPNCGSTDFWYTTPKALECTECHCRL